MRTSLLVSSISSRFARLYAPEIRRSLFLEVTLLTLWFFVLLYVKFQFSMIGFDVFSFYAEPSFRKGIVYKENLSKKENGQL